MLLGCYFQVVLLVANAALVINNNVENDQNNATDGILFTDVITNISMANNVLQELIKNYAQLQKMFQTRSLEIDYTSDSEIDEVFKNAKANYKRISKTRNDSYFSTDLTVYPPTKRNFPGTEMIISEEDVENITEKSTFFVGENRTPSIQSLQSPNPVNISKVQGKESNENVKDKAPHIDHKHSDEIKVPNNVFYDNVQPMNISKTTTLKMKSENSDYKHSEEIKVTNNVFNNTVLTTKSNNATKLAKSKHKKSKHKKHKNKDSTRQNSMETFSTTKVNVQGNARNVQKILRTESFHEETFWDEIVNKKPIELRASRHLPYKTKRDIGNQYKFWKEPDPKKTALVILTHKKASKQESEEDSSVSITKEDEEINKELLKTNILRMAYGEACLKVAVKKCYKALKLVIKHVCRSFKCKSSFKDKVREHSKTGCIHEFNKKEKEKKENSSVKYRGVEDDVTFVDATRGGLEACFPFMERTIFRNETPPPPGADKKVNILRDRFERACERASAKKCKKACKIAFDSACATYECSKRKKKIIKKSCKKKCKLAYKSHNKKMYSSRSSDSSNSKSDSDSASESGSDAESDDSVFKSADDDK